MELKRSKGVKIERCSESLKASGHASIFKRSSLQRVPDTSDRSAIDPSAPRGPIGSESQAGRRDLAALRVSESGELGPCVLMRFTARRGRRVAHCDRHRVLRVIERVALAHNGHGDGRREEDATPTSAECTTRRSANTVVRDMRMRGTLARHSPRFISPSHFPPSLPLSPLPRLVSPRLASPYSAAGRARQRLLPLCRPA